MRNRQKVGERPETYSLEKKERVGGSLGVRRGGGGVQDQSSLENAENKTRKSLSSRDLQWVTERTRAENGSAQIATFRDVAKY